MTGCTILKSLQLVILDLTYEENGVYEVNLMGFATLRSTI